MNLRNEAACVKGDQKNVRVADAKEVGVGNPAEETYCHPNNFNLRPPPPSLSTAKLEKSVSTPEPAAAGLPHLQITSSAG